MMLGEVDIFSIAELGKIIRAVRKESGLTQRDTAGASMSRAASCSVREACSGWRPCRTASAVFRDALWHGLTLT
jgi:hypothetical protein